jgi:lysine/arginine/ornithine transport system substrate-binding protein
MKTWLWAALLLAAAGWPHQAAAQAEAPPAEAPPAEAPPAAAPPAAAGGVVRIGTLANYPPFEYSSSSGSPKGMEIELGNQYCAVAHLQCKWVTLPFTQLIPSLLDHKVDAVLAQLSITAERAAKVSFTAPVTYNSVVVLGRKGSSITDDPATMRGARIGVGSETVEAAWAQSHLRGIATVRTYDDGAQELQDLRDHKLDAVILDQPAAYDFLREGGKFDFTFLGKPLEDPMILGAGNTAIAVRKDDLALRDAFDLAISAVRQDGTFEKVSAMYFPFNMQPK